MAIQLLFVFFGWLAHPFHVSVCDIEVNSVNSSLEISQRIFLDDLQLALRTKSGWENLDVLEPKDKKRFDELMKAYITDNLHIQLNGKPVKTSYLGHEVEADAMWCYVEVSDIEKIQQIQVENTLLLDTYDDQVNLVHIKNDGKIRSLKLYQNNATGSISYH